MPKHNMIMDMKTARIQDGCEEAWLLHIDPRLAFRRV